MKKTPFIILGFSALFLGILFYMVNVIHADSTLSAYWKFDETSGTTAVDSSGNSQDGTNYNATISTDVPSVSFTDLRSLNFDSSNNAYVQAPGQSALAGSHSRTIALWFKTSFTSGDQPLFDSGGTGHLATMQIYTVAANGAGGSPPTNPGGTAMVFWDLDIYSPIGISNVADGNWHSIVFTYDQSTNQSTLYFDGSTVQSYLWNGTWTSLESEPFSLSETPNTTENPVLIGKSRSKYFGISSGTTQFDGNIDDVRIYDSALTSTEVNNLYLGYDDPDTTPTPTPAPTPTPSPTSTPSNNNSSSSSTSNKSQTCTSSSPSAPDLFQVSTSLTSATEYFAPVSSATGYVVGYGINTNADQYTASFNNSETGGALTYTINSLASNTKYYFKVRGQNGCMPGLWSQVLSQTTTGAEIANQISQTKTSEKTSLTSTPTPKGTISVVNQTQTQTGSTNPTQSGYDLNVTVQKNGQPVANATVELHSTPQRTTTDKNGIARFTNVAGGNHTVLLAYQGYSGQEKVSVSGKKKDIAIQMNIKLSDTRFASPIANIIIGVLLVIILMLFFFLIAKKRRKKKEELS